VFVVFTIYNCTHKRLFRKLLVTISYKLLED